MKNLITTLIAITLLSSNAYGYCQACWSIKRVEIITCDSKTVNGYILWNDAWLMETDPSNKTQFPESVLKFLKLTDRQLIVHKNLVLFEKLFQKAPLSVYGQDTLNLKDICKISSVPDKFENIKGASRIDVISKKAAKQFKTKPLAIYSFDFALSTMYFVSYNKDYDKDKLISLSKTQFWDKESEYEKLNVYFVEVGYD